MAAVLVALAGAPSPAAAAPGSWTYAPVQRAGAVQSAVLSASVVSVNGVGGVVDGAYRQEKMLTAADTVGVVDVRNTSSVPLALAGTVQLQNLLTSTTVEILRCSTAWAPSGCPGTMTTLVARAEFGEPRTVVWAGAVPAGDVVHLQMTMGGSVSNVLVASVVAAPGRSGTDRTYA